MITLSPEEAGRALGLTPLAVPVTGVSTDTRTLQPGDLFLALRGEHFDGHDFIDEALRAGAAAVVVDRTWIDEAAGRGLEGSAKSQHAVYAVQDTLEALGALARAVRRKSGALVIAITGSVGKTSTKDLLGAMAGRVGSVVVTAANQNNEVGVPLTLLSLCLHSDVAVIEMGMRGRGQIAALAKIAEPDVGLVTNVYPVHLEVLGSLEGIAEAKAELFHDLKPDGVAVLPHDCALLGPRAMASGRRTIRFGFGAGSERADFRGIIERVSVGARAIGPTALTLLWPEGRAEVAVPFASRYRLENTIAAAAACYAAGLPVAMCAAGAADVSFTPARGDLLRLGGVQIIDDTYNANPEAVRAALDDLVDTAASQGGRPVAVLGDMLELGPEADRYHWETGAYAAEVGVRLLWGVGPLSENTVDGFRHMAKDLVENGSGELPVADWLESAAESARVETSLAEGDVVLFKASRAVRLELMIERIAERNRAGAEWRTRRPTP